MKKKAPISLAKTKSTTRKKPGSSKSFKRKVFIFLMKTGVALMLLAFLLFLIVYVGFTGPVPSSEELQKIKNPVGTEVYANDGRLLGRYYVCLLYTSDAADEEDSVDLGGRRIIKKKKKIKNKE